MKKKEHKCDECPNRKKYDANPKSFVGRLWRWHIKFCPGWKSYMDSLSEEKRDAVKRQYNIR